MGYGIHLPNEVSPRAVDYTILGTYMARGKAHHYQHQHTRCPHGPPIPPVNTKVDLLLRSQPRGIHLRRGLRLVSQCSLPYGQEAFGMCVLGPQAVLFVWGLHDVPCDHHWPVVLVPLPSVFSLWAINPRRATRHTGKRKRICETSRRGGTGKT